MAVCGAGNFFNSSETHKREYIYLVTNTDIKASSAKALEHNFTRVPNSTYLGRSL